MCLFKVFFVVDNQSFRQDVNYLFLRHSLFVHGCDRTIRSMASGDKLRKFVVYPLDYIVYKLISIDNLTDAFHIEVFNQFVTLESFRPVSDCSHVVDFCKHDKQRHHSD